MDDIKDIDKKDSFSKFFDSTSIRTDAFGQNIFAERAYRRAERITAAIHLVTNHIPSGEPIKNTLRTVALDLLAATLALRDELRSAESREFISVQGLVRVAISHVRILSVSGRISMQNAEALIAALDDLGFSLSVSLRSHLSESISLRRDMFAVDEEGPGVVKVTDKKSSKAARRIKDIRRSGTPERSTPVSQNTRSEEILSVLGAQGQLGIKDISAGLPTYSEKMIQRELKRLVDLGRVAKVGAKRWSMYTLAKQ